MGPVRGRQGKANLVAGGKAMTAHAHLHAYIVCYTHLQRLGGLMPVAMREVQQSPTHKQGFPVRSNIFQTGRHCRPRPIHIQAHPRFGVADHRHGLREGVRCEAQRTFVVRALVDCHLVHEAVGAPNTRRLPTFLPPAQDEAHPGLNGGVVCGKHDGAGSASRLRANAPIRHQSSFATQSPNLILNTLRGPRSQPQPSTGSHTVESGRRHIVLQPNANGRLIHDPGIHTLEPLVPPTHGLLQEGHGRPRDAFVRHRVPPRPDQTQPRYPQVLQETRDCVGVGVGPTAHHKHRAFHGTVILGYRPVLPELITQLMGNPVAGQFRRVLQTPTPHPPPACSHETWIGRLQGDCQHGAGPLQHVGAQQASPHVVAVVAIAVVGGGHRDHGPQLRGAAGGDLQPVEPTPRVADHAHPARAPGLVCKPGQHLQRIVLLLREILSL